MHFGPEWMRTKQAPARTTEPSPPLANPPTPAAPASSYSALVAPSVQPPPDKHDLARPFRFSKEDLLRIYKEGGGRGGLGLEVERWEGIVREVGLDPVTMKEMSEGEKKIYAGQLNSEVRRRQSMDYLAPLSTERPKLGHHNSTGPASPLRERMGNFAPLQSPRDAPLASPRTRIGPSGFDGGVLDGSWTSKRRAAEAAAAAKASGKVDREPEKNGCDVKTKEEQEEPSLNGSVLNPSDSNLHNGSGGATANDPPPAQLDIPTSTNSSAAASPVVPTGPPPGIDFAGIEWSYLDPQGQVQGPFRADIMQKWYDSGYFTADLLMKRTHLESDWTAVRVLQQNAVSTPIFLTPMAPPRPPEPQPVPVDFATLNGTHYDQELQRPLATSQMNARLHDGSNPSDSPMSSYSNPHFSNNSPDPSVLAGRPMNSGLGDVAQNAYSNLSTLDAHRLSPAHDGRSHVLNQGPIGRNGLEALNTNGYPGTNAVNGSFGSPMDLHGGLNGFQQHPSDFANIGYNMTSSEASAAAAGLRLDPRYGGGFAPTGGSPFVGGQQYSPVASSPFMGQQDLRMLQQVSPFPGRRTSGSTHMLLLQQQQNMQQQTFLPQSSIPTQQSRMTPDQLGYRRPGPFDVNYPTVQNTIAQHRTVTPSQASSYSSHQPLQNGILPPDHSPWFAASKGVVPDGWGQEPNSLTVANLGQHNQLQSQDTEKSPVPSAEPKPVAAAEPTSQEVPAATVPPSPITPSIPAGDAPRTSKSRRKPSIAIAKTTAASTTPPAPAAVTVKPPTPPPEVKSPAWNVEEDKASSGAVMTLREIQEAEVKKADARKAAERERAAARAAATATTPTTEPVQAFTASWGLPTSQVARPAPLTTKETPGASIPTSSSAQSPVWTTAIKPVVAKKTMKEIQEEEERRKKAAIKEKESMAAAARRGYADTTTKAAPVVTTGGAWTTVGSSGKVSTPTAAAPTLAARPAIPASVSVKVAPGQSMASTIAAAAPVPTRTISGGTVVPRTVAVAATKTSSKVDEFPAPSADFLKWLGDSLKGLNSSVNLEEIASMLLQFPIDPDPSTVEIISDLIYANSTTLDGRRFAAEFVSKRKASTKTGAAPAVGGPSGKLSIADVVKTQPKSTQNEWGGFKVVNKKKKGGRS
ncbi:hypothetical protein EUX98_g4021 [Antrodiella citrinella]|uniref:GYF domain-containing protein n=1 Tax=Antrodiella citrinella TaxID=2447956 RepID=A0A4S4MXY7_9APHY|nr:hypothetical protein EUX98_g4021 [Antrodiella citrinella]